jgi:hypothetical protein
MRPLEGSVILVPQRAGASQEEEESGDVSALHHR